MVELFADLPPDHEYFRQFNFIAADDLADYRALVSRGDTGRLKELSPADQERLLALPFKLIAARHRLGLITDELMDKILGARRFFRDHLPEELAGAIDFFDPGRYNRPSTVQENILFGKVAYGQAQSGKRIGALIDAIVDELELRSAITEVGLAGQCGFAGSRLSPAQRQKLAIARAVLKRPEVIVLYDATGPLDAIEQARLRDRLLEEFQHRTVIWALQQHEWADRFDIVLEMERGRVKREELEHAEPAAAE
jgi:ABC-type oligopeptide transport system ATPase subunit